MADLDRSKKLKRLVGVQRHMEKMIENELAIIVRQGEEVNAAMELTANVMTSLDPIHRGLSRHYLGRFSRLATEEKQLMAARRSQETRLAKERSKGDKLDERRKEALEQEQRASEDDAVYNLLEMMITLKDASFQQG
ncbi:hypothetical protein [Aliirhizobium smilacinae]|uniref:Flagellar export protein FliJ n=1 Tax=Aliirhizobium smilacinae TaxID=1395944 RepID=A0A5C4XRH7_9HYPH|nr:hypothetical protein [Rhizobium smilacinae]TNM66075.1 hypothetical protein FHP24_07615 [Rhizobium smilacinae]